MERPYKSLQIKGVLWMLACILFFSVGLRAQDTLTQTSYPVSVLGTDSLKLTAHSSVFPVLAPAANGSWDLSTVLDSVPDFFAYRVSTVGHLYADSNWYNFSTFDYQGNAHIDIIPTGILESGLNVEVARHSLFFLTGVIFDSFIINSQNILYSSPRTKIAFPATYHSSWSSSWVSDLHFQLTFLADGDTLSPGIIRTYTTEKDSVTGWGKMRIKDASGSPSAYLNVLQVQTTITRTDSFFLNGVPFSSVLLTNFNLVQGQKDTVYEQNYYRPQEVTPLARVEFHDAAFVQPFRATTHVQRLQPVSVHDLVNATGIHIYPNPSAGRTVSVETGHQQGAWSYELISISGQKIIEGPLRQPISDILLPSVLTPGIYYLSLYCNSAPVVVKPLEIN